MSRGGHREGAGRPKGSTGKRSKELQDLVERQGDLRPGRVMLEGMWWHYDEILLMQQDSSFANTREGKKLMKEFNMNLLRVAKYVAPYIHPKLPSCHDVVESAEASPEDEKVCDSPEREPFPTSEEMKKMDVATLTQMYRDMIAQENYKWQVEQAAQREEKKKDVRRAWRRKQQQG